MYPANLALEAAHLQLRTDRFTAIEAAATVMLHLSRGEEMTPRMVAAMTGWSPHDAARLLARMSRVVPIYSDSGRWQMCAPA
jgi:hypothetical protein